MMLKDKAKCVKAISIMQPYVFPYIGYFHLIEATDKIVFYDDVSYRKRSWINRNRILLNNSEYLFTIPVAKASQNKLINEIVPIMDSNFIKKFLAQIEMAYKKSPYYEQVKEVLLTVLTKEYANIADLAINSIIAVYDYLGKDLAWTKSSICSPETIRMEKSDRLIQIAKDLGYDEYVNSIGGQEIYDKSYFKNKGVELSFVLPGEIHYKQFNDKYIPNLSIIDILMFNDLESVKDKLSMRSLL